MTHPKENTGINVALEEMISNKVDLTPCLILIFLQVYIFYTG